eukprot:1424447-Rhodomonas_salina.2
MAGCSVEGSASEELTSGVIMSQLNSYPEEAQPDSTEAQAGMNLPQCCCSACRTPMSRSFALAHCCTRWSWLTGCWDLS